MSTGGIEWTAKVGDTGPSLSLQLRMPPTRTQRIGDVVDLSAVDSIVWTARRNADTVVAVDVAPTVVDAAQGIVSTPMTATMTELPGLVAHEVVATWSDGQQLSFPAEPGAEHVYLRVRGDLMSSAVPVATSGPSGVATHVGGAVFIPDGTSDDVTVNGQSVRAGHNATINVADGVTHFTVSYYPGQTPWAAGTTPSIVQSGVALDAGVTSALLNSEGDGVSLDSDGATWFADTPAVGAGGADVDSFTHSQTTADSTWTILHGLNRAVAVSVEDDLGNDVTPDNVDRPNLNTVVITFLSARTGTAYIT